MHGREEIRRYWETLRQTWDNVRIDPLEGFDLGKGRFVIDQRLWAKGAGSGITVDQRFAMYYVLRVEDDLVSHAQLLPDVATAIALAESASPRASSAT